jgi:prepilin signal peptidase PulO-like enzyme (type II secretory pathway)
VISTWLGLTLEIRLIALGLMGLACGSLANYLIYTWCYFPRPISPWATPHVDAAFRTAKDRIPIVGWIRLRREKNLHGPWFWMRPMMIEIALMVALPLLYRYETQMGGLFPLQAQNPQVIALAEPWMTRMFFVHAALLFVMTAATFIDFDEQTIPDILTIPGTIVALISGALSVQTFMPGVVDESLEPVTFNLPMMPPDPSWWTYSGLWVGITIWSVWCFALADRRVILRRGWQKAIEYFLAGLVRYPTWKVLASIWLVGLLVIGFVFWLGGSHWFGLLTSLIGLAVGGGIVWAVRIVASWSMRTEAMGFGDVTLMAMIGAVIGWQGSLAAFFLAPLTAIVIVMIQYLITREPRVPFGPYLCAGTAVTILGWATIYNDYLAPNLMLGQMLFGMFVVLFLLMSVFLVIWRMIKTALFG